MEQDEAITSVYGIVCGHKDDDPCYLLEATPRHITLSEITGRSFKVPQMGLSGSGATFKLVGKLLHLARPYVRKAKPPRTRGSVTPEELKEVVARAEGRPVEGYQFDGAAYVDYFGTRMYQRPDLEELVAEYLEGVNKAIAAENQRFGVGV